MSNTRVQPAVSQCLKAFTSIQWYFLISAILATCQQIRWHSQISSGLRWVVSVLKYSHLSRRLFETVIC